MPLCSVSLDLDNKWSYMKTYGDPEWQKFPSYFEEFIPRVLDILDRLDLKITFFVVGQDAALEKNKAALQQIISRGHEIGNHSYHHEPWINSCSQEQIREEVEETEHCILEATGWKPEGFRGPGFSWSPELLGILNDKGYMYDATTLPMFIGPLARVYYFWKSRLSQQEREQRKELFGSFMDGFRPVLPYVWQLPSNQHFLEIPITTMPILKAPFHLSYLLYLSQYSESVMKSYFSLAIGLCKMLGYGVSFLLHPLDILDKDDVPELAFFPGMQIDGAKKVEIFYDVLDKLSQNYQIVNMSRHAEYLLENGKLKRLKP